MNTTKPPTQGKAGSGLPPIVVRSLIALVILLLIVIGLYWAGLSHGRAQMAQQKTDYEARLKTAQSQTADAQTQIAAIQAQNQLMTARGLLYQAAIALDQRNFGIANDDVTKAGQELATARPASPAVAAPLDGVRQAVGSTKVAVAQDLDAQRAHLLDLASQLNALIH